MTREGHYQCVKCQFVWSRANGPGGGHCPKCNSSYMKWTDYERFQVEPKAAPPEPKSKKKRQ